MKKVLLIIALLVSGLGLNAQNDGNGCPVPTGVKVKGEINVPDFGKLYKVTVSWDAVPEAELYAVYATSQYVPEPMWVGDVYDGTEWVFGSDLGGELYFYVRTICDAENMIVSEISEGVNIILNEDLETTVIEAPKNLTATVKDNSSIELTWDAAENAESYFVYRNGEEIANIKGTTYLDENLKVDTEYCYMVTTMGINEESDPSELFSTTSTEAILPPATTVFTVMGPFWPSTVAEYSPSLMARVMSKNFSVETSLANRASSSRLAEAFTV